MEIQTMAMPTLPLNLHSNSRSHFPKQYSKDHDHRISFFQALYQFFTSEKIPSMMKTLLIRSAICLFAYLLLPPIIFKLAVAAVVIALFTAGETIYYFLNSPEYLLTKGTKKLTANWEQLKKRKESHEEQLNKLYLQGNDSDKQKEIPQKQKLIRKIENEMRIIEIALRKLHDMKNTQNNN